MRKEKHIILVIAVLIVLCLAYIIVGIYVCAERPFAIMGGILGCFSAISIGVIAMIQDWKIYELSRMDQRKADVILERCCEQDKPYSASNVTHRQCGISKSAGGEYLVLSLCNYLDNPVIDIKAKSYTVNGKQYNYTEIDKIVPDEHNVSTLYKNARIELSCWVPKDVDSYRFEIVFSNLDGDMFSKEVSVLRKEGNLVFGQAYSRYC